MTVERLGTNICTMSIYTIFYDEETEKDWFCKLHPSLERVAGVLLKERGRNPAVIDSLAAYDRPDIVLAKDGVPVLVLEKTREVPTGHNVGQRMARLVRAAEMRIPVVAFFPFDARKHGAYSSLCNLNARILDAFDAMWRIHGSPVIAINWKTDKDGELVGDGTEDLPVKNLIHSFLAGNCSLPCPGMNAFRISNQQEYQRRVARRKLYGAPPSSVSLISTQQLIDTCARWLSGDQAAALLTKNECVTYGIGMEEQSCRREDPFTGTQFIYDYCYCRNGPNVGDKHRNLVLSFPKIRKRVWLEKNPNNSSRKSCNWYLTANALVFSDGIIWLR